MSHHKILKLKVTDGFLGGIDLDFSDGLVCIIGSRGSGKTTILELIRFALNRMPRNSSQKRFMSLIESNLGRGTVEVTFETMDGIGYKVERRVGEDPMVFAANGTPVDPKILDSGIQMDSVIISQNEVEEIAMQSGYLRDVLDRFCANDLEEIQRGIGHAQERLKQNASESVQLTMQMQEHKGELDKLPELQTRLDALNNELAQANLDPAMGTAADHKNLRTQEATSLGRVNPVLSDAHKALTPLQRSIVGEFRQVFSEDILQGPNGAIFEELRLTLRAGVEQFREGIKQAEQAIQSMQEAVEQSNQQLAQAHRPQEAGYQELIKQTNQHQQMLRERDSLAKQVATLRALKEDMERTGKRLDALHSERKSLLIEHSNQVERRFRLREEVAHELSDQLTSNIRIRVSQGADRDAYHEFLVQYRDQSSTRYNPYIAKITSNFSPQALAKLVDARNYEDLVAETDISERFAVGLLNRLAETPRTQYELETLTVDDLPTIELQVGNEWRESSRLSTGQMCSVVLPVLLLESAAPLIIDQPEDNLDNRYVSIDVVDMIKKSSTRRQMVFITHNPNIPVLGMAKQVIVMDSSDNRGKIIGSGTVDAMQDDIVRLLEGGKSAFMTRKEQYGW